ncbi:conjugal transfer protein TraB, partial [Neorhizobium galegae]|uniref:conjugal transfer protein TraB n=1 Tax=Neorhizobium galegae TaxID=399 RepID=UPI0020360802
LAASRGLTQGVAAFYQSDIWPGLILWVVASSGFVVVHAALWSRHSGGWKALRYVIAMVLMALPPFGIVGWAHPITAAGVLFPAWGWCGLAAVTAGLAIMTTRYRPAAAVTLACFWLWSAAFWTAPEIGQHWQGIDLQLGNSLGRDISLGRHRELAATLRSQRRPDTAYLLLPESALGFWTPSVAHLWRQQFTGTDLNVIAGAVVVDPEGYDNVLVRVSATESEILYRERMPVPGSMWQPWLPLIGKSGGARAHFFANPIVSVGGQRVAPLICYEQLIVWPVLQSMLHDPDLIAAVGNDWWTKGTSIIAIQRASSEAWARLFGKPLTMSFNI